jgi:hypothetical protein
MLSYERKRLQRKTSWSTRLGLLVVLFQFTAIAFSVVFKPVSQQHGVLVGSQVRPVSVSWFGLGPSLVIRDGYIIEFDVAVSERLQFHLSRFEPLSSPLEEVVEVRDPISHPHRPQLLGSSSMLLPWVCVRRLRLEAFDDDTVRSKAPRWSATGRGLGNQSPRDYFVYPFDSLGLQERLVIRLPLYLIVIILIFAGRHALGRWPRPGERVV